MLSAFIFIQSVYSRATDRLSSEEKGATATEYSLLVGLIALALVVGVGVFGTALNTWFTNLGTTVGGWTTPAG